MKRLASESLVYGMASVLSKMLNILLLPLYANVLTPNEYGIISLLTVFSSLLVQLAVLQLDSGAFRFIMSESDTQDVKKTLSSWAFSQTAFSILLLLLCVLFAGSLSELLFDRNDLGLLIGLSAAVLPFAVAESLQVTVWRIHGKKWPVALLTLGSVAAMLILNYWFIALLHWGVKGLLLATLITHVAKTLLLVPGLIPKISMHSFNWARLREMLQYSLPFVPAGISLWVISLIDRFILQKYTSTEEVAVYQMAYTVAALMLMPVNAFLQAWSPYMFSLLAQPAHRVIIARGTLLFVALTSLAALIITVWSSEFLAVLTAPVYFRSNEFVPLLLFANILIGVYQLSGAGCSIARKTQPVMWATLGAAILNIVLNIFLIPEYHSLGAAISTLISYALIPVILFVASQRVYPMPYSFWGIIAVLVSMFLISWICRPYFENFDMAFVTISWKALFMLGLIMGCFVFRKKIVAAIKSS